MKWIIIIIQKFQNNHLVVKNRQSKKKSTKTYSFLIKKRKNNGNKTETKILIEVVALSFFKCIIIIKHIIHLGTLKEDKD